MFNKEDDNFVNPWDENHNFKEIAEALFNQKTPLHVEMASLKCLVTAMCWILMDKKVITQEEMTSYVKQSFKMFKLLKNMTDD